MKVLILTQKVDSGDPVLGFFHRWLEEFANNFEHITVICLERGIASLPSNVKILSLGKENNNSLIKYLLNFYKYIWKERNNYDCIFIHMNQEYVILGWKTWLLLGKKIYLWRNHLQGNIFTRMAAFFSHKVFYTSPQSFTARFRNSVQMPAGIDTNFFKPDPEVFRKKGSVLFLGRIAPVKKVLEFVEWFKENQSKGLVTEGVIAGSALPRDKWYEEEVRKRIAELKLETIKLIGPVTQNEALKLYQCFETYVNLTPSGSMDKTILEAAACEAQLVVENKALKFLEGKSGKDLRDYVVENHSLEFLMKRLMHELC